MFYDIWVEFLASCSAKTDFHEKWHFVLSKSTEMAQSHHFKKWGWDNSLTSGEAAS